ncbi:alpha/beta hydrolase fold domain-containing protein [Mycobacterium sp. ACS1612]|uniref:alpha/beta hydrolase fold domain-containing protein n=1 Tax=Mycobacterium sp. ACS1612 TaxID=1834117 RepID=UPI0018D49782|nr:alpha/beta hydrolase [Mycobacterium sp. ACS1612]
MASEHAETARSDNRESPSSSEAATPTASTPAALDTSTADGPAVNQPVNSTKAGGTDVTSRQPHFWSAMSDKASGLDIRPAAPMAAFAPQAVRPSKIDATKVASRTGSQLSAKPVSEAHGALSTYAAAQSWTDAEHSAVAAMPTAAVRPAGVASSTVASLVNAVLNPIAAGAPVVPVEPPMMLTLLAFVRREFEGTVSSESPTVNPLAGQITNGLVTGTTALDDQSANPAIVDKTAPLAGVSDLTLFTHLNATAAPATFTGEPSFVSQVFTAFYRAVGAVGDFLGVDLTTPLGHLLSSDRPLWFTTLGLNVQRSEFDGIPVWTLQSPWSTSEKVVVAIPGSAFVWPPTVFHWFNYAAMARNTGATVIVPIYPVVPQGGTAATVVPAMADLISSQIDQRGAENVSVYGDSLGGTIGLAAVQELVRRGDSVPSHMVLISPALDLTFNNPAIQFVDDPVFSGLFFSNVRANAQLWAGDLDLTDPLVSPLFGSLAGLPPTALYFGSREVLAPDGLVLQDIALATPGANFTFILRNGELHIWAVNVILPETIAVLPDIYQQLGIAA